MIAADRRGASVVAALALAGMLGACAGTSGPPSGSSARGSVIGPADSGSAAGAAGAADTAGAGTGASAATGAAAQPAAGRGADTGTARPPSPSPATADPGSPARLAADPPQACLDAIEGVAERASGNRVLLGPAAFATSDELVLVRAPVRGPGGALLDGRMPAPSPVVLKLSLGAQGCSIRQVPASGGLPDGSARAEAAVPIVVTDPVLLPACRCLRLPD